MGASHLKSISYCDNFNIWIYVTFTVKVGLYSQEQVVYKFLATRIYKFIFCSWVLPLHKMAANLTILNNRFFSFWIIARIQKLLQSQKCTE